MRGRSPIWSISFQIQNIFLLYFIFSFDWNIVRCPPILSLLSSTFSIPSLIYFELIYINMLTCYMPTYLHIYISKYVYMHTCLHFYMPIECMPHACMQNAYILTCLLHTGLFASRSVYIHANIQTCLYEYMPTGLCVYMHTFLLASTSVCIHDDIPIYLQVYMPTW